jgi:uncharacterized membrane protein YkvI
MLIIAYLGAVIGAGFASGQEIVQFFVNYGAQGLEGGVIAAILFALSGGLLLNIAHKNDLSNYQELLQYLLGGPWGKVMDFMLAVFLFLGISTMIAASGAIFSEHLYLSKYAGIILAYLLIVLMLGAGKKGLINSYNLLVPVKIIVLLAITGYAAIGLSGNQAVPAQSMPIYTHGHWGVASILYVAYNFALAMVVLTEYKTFTTRQQAVGGAIAGGLLLGFLVVLYYGAMVKYLPEVSWYEIPMLYITGHISPFIKTVYILILWIGILTTALANAYGFSQRTAQFTGLRYQTCLVIGMTLALPLSMRDFSALVGKIYPLFGLLGIFILTALIYKSVKEIGLELYYKINHIVTKHWGA